MNATLFGDSAAFLLVFAFALTLGAQAFDTFVNVPVFFRDPPQSITEYMAYPGARRVPLYFARTGILVIVAVLAATAALILERGSIALLAADSCAVVYIALILVVFIPVNRKLGFLPGGNVEPRDAARLSRRWRTWNAVRLIIQAFGLATAVLSLGRWMA